MGLILPLVLRPTDAMIILHTCAGTLVTTATDTGIPTNDDINQKRRRKSESPRLSLLEASWGSPQKKVFCFLRGSPTKGHPHKKQNTFLSGKRTKGSINNQASGSHQSTNQTNKQQQWTS
jgi:hypothetical protein